MIQYDKYKDSGIEWIGEIPEHWEVKKFKYFANIGNGKDHKNVWDENGMFQIIGSGGKFGLANQYLFDKTSIILGRKGTIDKPQFINEPFWPVDTVYYTIIKSDTNSKYFYYLCKTINFDLYKYGSAVPSMNQETLKEIYFSAPLKLEQTAIANFLDRKTAEIDTLIAKKEKLLKLYEEEKTAVINQAVTKGVPRKDGRSSVSYKDSGIDWLGEIPEHWEVKKLKYVLNERMKYGANESALYENRNDPRYIRITDFGNDGKLRNNTFKSLPPEVAKDYMLKQGDILFARSGATVGKTFQFKDYNGMACFAGYLIKASPNYEIIISDFLYLFTKTSLYERWKESIFNQATIQNIGADKYVYLNIPIPKTEEQTAIVKFIEIETNRINSKITKTEKLIELLKEYKTALISEVVTGKVKVV